VLQALMRFNPVTYMVSALRQGLFGPGAAGAVGTPPAWRFTTLRFTGGRALLAEGRRGWVGAACEQRPELAAAGEAYLRRRLAECAAGRLRATVGHADLLALPADGGGR